NPQHVRNFTFTGKVYIHHVDRLTHEQMGYIENAFHAEKLEAVLRGPDFLTQAWIAWKEKGPPNITWDTISLQKLVFENGRFRRFMPYETAAVMFGIFIVAKNPPIKGQKVISAGDVKARLLFKLKQGEFEISPGAWVDEPYSSVRLDVGDTRPLLLAVSQSYYFGLENGRQSERIGRRRNFDGLHARFSFVRRRHSRSKPCACKIGRYHPNLGNPRQMAEGQQLELYWNEGILMNKPSE